MTNTAFTSLLSDLETRAGSGISAPVDAPFVLLWLNRVRSCGVLEHLQTWRDADRVASGKRPGGRTPLITDEVILVVSLALVLEGSKVQPHEMGRMLEFRLTEAAREALGIAHLYDKPRDWLHLGWRAAHRLIDTFDGWPAKRHTLSLEDRIAIESARDQERITEMRARGERFTSDLIEMGLALLPEDQQTQPLALSVDQSSIRAGSQLRRWKRDANGVEQPKYNKHTGKEHDKYVLELEADLYPVKKGVQFKDRTTAEAHGVRQEYEMSFMANLIVDVVDDPDADKTNLPRQLIRAASLGTPNRRIGEHTLALLDLIAQRGHDITRLTFDRGYNYLPGFHEALRDRGIPTVQDYMKHQKGITNGVGGAKFVEGGFYCNGTPQHLLDATIDFDAGTIDEPTYWRRINERSLHALHLKEGPDANGTVKMRCPALGPSATVECPLRELHPKASSKKDRAVISKRNIQKGERPRVCCQSSISITKDIGVQERQKYTYGSKQWFKVYRADRNSIESANYFLKNIIGLGDTSRRAMRGLAAQQFILALHVVAANHKRITDYAKQQRKLQERIENGTAPIARKTADEKLQRRRDRLGLSRYKRNPEPLELVDPPKETDAN